MQVTILRRNRRFEGPSRDEIRRSAALLPRARGATTRVVPVRHDLVVPLVDGRHHGRRTRARARAAPRREQGADPGAQPSHVHQAAEAAL
jgi:hypothetical protein